MGADNAVFGLAVPTGGGNAPLYYLKTVPDRIEMVLWLMAEGVDVSVIVCYTGHIDLTITRRLERVGTLAFSPVWSKNLNDGHVQSSTIASS